MTSSLVWFLQRRTAKDIGNMMLHTGSFLCFPFEEILGTLDDSFQMSSLQKTLVNYDDYTPSEHHYNDNFMTLETRFVGYLPLENIN